MAETFTDDAVMSFSNSNLVSIKLKPWEDENASDLFDKYNGQAIPLLIYLNQDGQEVDRILGFYPPDEYLSMIEDIYNGKNTYLSLKQKYLSGDYSSDVLSRLSEKCKVNHEQELCESVYGRIITLNSDFEAPIIFQSELFFATKEMNKDIIDPMFRLLERYSNSEFIPDVYSSIIRYFKSNGDTQKEASTYKEYTDQINNDPSILNQYAWRMTEIGVNFEDALAKSSLAIELSADNLPLKSYIIDTKAELLWLLGRTQEAVEIINIAIEIDPNSEYFKEQKDKFQNSIKE